MTPFLFGESDRRLFGVLNPRSGTGAPKLGVVLSNAFGREAIRAHRVFRVLSDRLSRLGCDVLRFDYFGTGDSAGKDSQVDLDGFQRDLLAAHAELRERSGAERIVWMGMRLGAIVAQRASGTDPNGLARTVLWDPIPDGRDYLDLLRRRHLEWATAGDNPIGDVPAVFKLDDSAYIDEAIGFPIPRIFCDQIRSWRFADNIRSTSKLTVVSDSSTSDGQEIVKQCQLLGLAHSEVVHGTDWTTEGDATGLVPPAVLNLLIQKIMETS
jgi:pimeloyl-ACP methyl ester carboxylesterase